MYSWSDFTQKKKRVADMCPDADFTVSTGFKCETEIFADTFVRLSLSVESVSYSAVI